MASMMAQNLSRGDLTVPDDDMEISSDAGRGADDTIDIDIDFDVPQAQPGDDDYMVEDDPSAPKTGPSSSTVLPSDSMMFDEDGNEQIQDDGMMDDDLEPHDEELLDASDSEDPDAEVTEITVYDQPQTIDDTTLQPVNPSFTGDDVAGPSKQIIEQTHGDEEHEAEGQSLVNNQGENEISYALPNDEHDEITTKTEAVDGGAPAVEHNDITSITNQVDTEDIQSTQTGTNEPVEQDEIAPVGAVEHDVEPTQNFEDHPQIETTQEEVYLQEERGSAKNETFVQDKNTNTERATDEGQLAPTRDSEVNEHDISSKSHPVVVLYEGAEVHLFPPAESDASATYFLNDENLVDSPLKDLLGEFRTVLGDSVTDNEELELEFGILGLSIVENSSEATLSTLASVLDVYCRLCQLDQILDSNGSPHPLHVVLRSKARFSARISQMYDLIEEGKGLSHVQFINSFVGDIQDDENEGGDDGLQQQTDKQEPLTLEGVTAPNAGGDGKDSYDTEAAERPDDPSGDIANEPAQVQDGVETLPVSTEQPNNETDIPSAKEDHNDDLIDYAEGEDDDKSNETSATTTTLQDEDQTDHHHESTYDTRGEFNTATSETQIDEENAANNTEGSVYQEQDLNGPQEQETELHEEFQDEESYEDQDYVNDDVVFDHVDFETAHGPDPGDIPGESEPAVYDTPAALETDDQEDLNTNDFLELQDDDADAENLEEEDFDESEFIHDDAEEAYDEYEGEIPANDPTPGTTASLSQNTSRKRSFAEHEGTGDTLESGNDQKRSKPA